MKNKIILETIKDTRNNIKQMEPRDKANIRSKMYLHLNHFLKNNKPITNTERILLNKSKFTSKFLSNNPNIIFAQADKGNSTVAILKNEYIDKINNMLSDTNTYIWIKNNPVKK